MQHELQIYFRYSNTILLNPITIVTQQKRNTDQCDHIIIDSCLAKSTQSSNSSDIGIDKELIYRKSPRELLIRREKNKAFLCEIYRQNNVCTENNLYLFPS